MWKQGQYQGGQLEGYSSNLVEKMLAWPESLVAVGCGDGDFWICVKGMIKICQRMVMECEIKTIPRIWELKN